MNDPQDRLELHGPSASPVPGQAGDPPIALGPRRRFLSVWFSCCHAYGRLSINAEGTRYEGGCPRCGRRTSATIGAGGTSRRMFEAR